MVVSREKKSVSISTRVSHKVKKRKTKSRQVAMTKKEKMVYEVLGKAVKAIQLANASIWEWIENPSTSRSERYKLFHNAEKLVENMWNVMHEVESEIKSDKYTATDKLVLQERFTAKTKTANDVTLWFKETVKLFRSKQRKYLSGIIDPVIRQAELAIDRLLNCIKFTGRDKLATNDLVHELYKEAHEVTLKMLERMSEAEAERLKLPFMGTSHRFLEARRKHVCVLHQDLMNAEQQINDSHHAHDRGYQLKSNNLKLSVKKPSARK